MEEMLQANNKMKKKMMAAIILFSLTVGIGSAYAVNAASSNDNGDILGFNENLLLKSENGESTYSTDEGQTWNDGVPSNGVTQYSTDDGQTWSDGLPPEGTGKSLIQHHGEAGSGLPELPELPELKGGEGLQLMVKKENGGPTQYSIDGGKTWSTEAPDGIEIKEDNGDIIQGMGFNKQSVQL